MSFSMIESVLPDVLSDQNELYEIVNGSHQGKLMGVSEVDIMSMLGIHLGHFSMVNQLGKVVVEMLFDFGPNETSKFRPDVAFVSYERWSKERKLPSENAWAVIPDLVVEVISPTNLAVEIENKVVKYLMVGVKSIWLVYPCTARIYIHESLSSVRVVGRDGEIDGENVLPGFRLPLVQLFEN